MRRSSSRLVSAAASLVAASFASADAVFLKADPGLLGSDSTVASFRYRASDTNWDRSVANSSTIRNSTIVQSRELGNRDQLNAAAFDFTLNYQVGLGYTFWLLHAGGGSPTTSGSSVAWTSPFGDTEATRRFRGLELSATAAHFSTSVQSASLSVTNLAFSGAGLNSVGTLSDMNAIFASGQFRTQYIASAADLSTFKWTLTGRVVAAFAYAPGISMPGGNLDERLRLNIRAFDGGLIPTPGGSAALILAGLVLARRRRW